MSSSVEHIPQAVAEVARVIQDPMLIVLSIVLLALVLVVFLLLRAMNQREKYISTLTIELHQNSQTLVRLTTLIEVMVNGITVKGERDEDNA